MAGSVVWLAFNMLVNVVWSPSLLLPVHLLLRPPDPSFVLLLHPVLCVIGAEEMGWGGGGWPVFLALLMVLGLEQGPQIFEWVKNFQTHPNAAFPIGSNSRGAF